MNKQNNKSEKMLKLFSDMKEENENENEKEEIYSPEENKDNDLNPLMEKKKVTKIAKTYAIDQEVIKMLAKMEDKSGLKPGELIAMAVSEFYNKYMNK